MSNFKLQTEPSQSCFKTSVATEIDEFDRFNIDHEPLNDLQIIEAEDQEQDATPEAYREAVSMASFGIGC